MMDDKHTAFILKTDIASLIDGIFHILLYHNMTHNVILMFTAEEVLLLAWMKSRLTCQLHHDGTMMTFCSQRRHY